MIRKGKDESVTEQQKSYHDMRRRALGFLVGDLRVTPVTNVGRALKSRKLTP
jgi:hypothetical protein